MLILSTRFNADNLGSNELGVLELCFNEKQEPFSLFCVLNLSEKL